MQLNQKEEQLFFKVFLRDKMHQTFLQSFC